MKIKKGDKIFVVRDRNRWKVQNNKPVEAFYVEVSKVGRKYGYFGEGYREEKFNLEDGSSAGDDNHRINGYGFDIYSSKEEWEKEVFERDELLRLNERLIDTRAISKRLHDFSPEVVQKIHKLLDQEGLD